MQILNMLNKNKTVLNFKPLLLVTMCSKSVSTIILIEDWK